MIIRENGLGSVPADSTDVCAAPNILFYLFTAPDILFYLVTDTGPDQRILLATYKPPQEFIIQQYFRVQQ
jgi:hypothetical protein